jgi:hypothetical protein
VSFSRTVHTSISAEEVADLLAIRGLLVNVLHFSLESARRKGWCG